MPLGFRLWLHKWDIGDIHTKKNYRNNHIYIYFKVKIPEILSCLVGSIYHSSVKDEFLALTRSTFSSRSQHPVYFSTLNAVLKWTFFKVEWKGGPPCFLVLLTLTVLQFIWPLGKMTRITLKWIMKTRGPFIIHFKGMIKDLEEFQSLTIKLLVEKGK